MSHKRILITLRGDQEDAEHFLAIVDRANAAGRSVNSQILIELGIIDEAKAAAVPRCGRRHKLRPIVDPMPDINSPLRSRSYEPHLKPCDS